MRMKKEYLYLSMGNTHMKGLATLERYLICSVMHIALIILLIMSAAAIL